MNRFTNFDGLLLTATFVPIIIYLFISWGPYPDIWNILFFGIPACSIQLLFCRWMHTKSIKALPLMIAATLSFRNLFILKYTPDLKFELPALCCFIIWAFCYKKDQKQS